MRTRMVLAVIAATTAVVMVKVLIDFIDELDREMNGIFTDKPPTVLRLL